VIIESPQHDFRKLFRLVLICTETLQG